MNRKVIVLASVMALATAGTISTALARGSQNNPWDWRSHDQRTQRSGDWRRDRDYRYSRNGVMRANTPFDVRIESKLSTDDIRQGEAWQGVVVQDVMSRGSVVLPAGTGVRGVVTQSVQGTHDQPASMNLAVREASINGDRVTLNADTEPIVAGSNRAKKIGAIAGGAAIGALLGHSISHEHGGVIGGLLGGAAGYGATRHAFRTLVLKPGTVVTFTTTQDVYAMR